MCVCVWGGVTTAPRPYPRRQRGTAPARTHARTHAHNRHTRTHAHNTRTHARTHNTRTHARIPPRPPHINTTDTQQTHTHASTHASTRTHTHTHTHTPTHGAPDHEKIRTRGASENLPRPYLFTVLDHGPSRKGRRRGRRRSFPAVLPRRCRRSFSQPAGPGIGARGGSSRPPLRRRGGPCKDTAARRNRNLLVPESFRGPTPPLRRRVVRRLRVEVGRTRWGGGRASERPVCPCPDL